MKFTVWGKVGTTPVRLTYDNGKLTGEPIEAVNKVLILINLVKKGKLSGLHVGPFTYGPDIIDTPLGYKGAIGYILTSLDKWEGELPMEPVPPHIQDAIDKGRADHIHI